MTSSTPQTPAAETARKLSPIIHKALDLAGMAHWNYTHDKASQLKYDPAEYNQDDIDKAYAAWTQCLAYIADLERENGRLKAFAEGLASYEFAPSPHMFDDGINLAKDQIAEQARDLLTKLAEGKAK